MTKEEALYKFFSEFGLTAYPSNAVPNDTTFPWLTYSTPIGYDGNVSAEVNLWYHTESEATPNLKADEISKALGIGGVVLPYDGGAIWIKRDNPFSQSLTDENDVTIKRRQINLIYEYL